MGRRVVFCEEAGAVVGCEDEDGVDGEEGEVGAHACSLEDGGNLGGEGICFGRGQWDGGKLL